jgi:hypothetical protein
LRDTTNQFGKMRVLITALVVMVGMCCALTRGSTADFERMVREIAGESTRSVGTPGAERSADVVVRELRSIEGMEVREHRYPLLLPTIREASLTVNGASFDVHPFWPASVRLVATPEEGISGKLVYCGRGEYQNLKPADLQGAIAVLEHDAGGGWMRAVSFGARAVMVLHDERVTHQDLRAFDVRLPLNVPRVYLSDTALIERIRSERVIADARLLVRADWQLREVRNVYGLLKPNPSTRTPAGERAGERAGARGRGVMTFLAPLDASGIVPGRAPGASQAINTAGLLAIARAARAWELDRPLLFAFTSGDEVQYHGTRQMLLALGDSPVQWQREIADLKTELANARNDAARMREMRETPERLSSKDDEQLIKRITQIIEMDQALERDELFRLRLKRDGDDAIVARRARLEKRQVDLSLVRALLVRNPAELVQEETRAIARTYLESALARIEGAGIPGLIQELNDRIARLETRLELYQWLASTAGTPTDPPLRESRGRAIDAILAIDISDGGLRIGPMTQGAYLRINARRDVRDFVDYFSRLRRGLETAESSAAWFGPLSRLIDPSTLITSATWGSFIPNLALPSEMASQWGIPALTFATLDDARVRRETPADRLDRIDLTAIIRQFEGMESFFEHALRDSSFSTNVELRRARNGFEGQVVSAALGKPVPDLPRPGFIASAMPAANTRTPPALHFHVPTVGVRRLEVAPTDALGRYRFEGLASQPDNMHQLFVQVYRVEEGSGRITAVSDMGKQSAEITPFVLLRSSSINPLRNVPFECTEIGLVGMYDPRYLQSLGDVQLLDARRNAVPQRFNILAADRMMAGFVESDGRYHLLFRYGQVGNRLMLINMPDAASPKPEGLSDAEWSAAKRLGRGFNVDELKNLDPVPLATARDFIRIDERRLSDYRSAGVSSALIDSIHNDANNRLDSAQEARSANDGATAISQANAAWSFETLVYKASKDMSNGVVRAAILLLLLAVPFSVCMERLLVASPSVYRQLTGIGAIFTVMTLALWAFHPAFKISSSPLIIILAFAIILMSLVVISVVYQKFDTELKKIRSGRGGAESPNFARSSVLTQAIMLGIANMRKRKIRTTLTATTIVLITFAVLVFASATSYRDITRLPTGVSSAHPGVHLRQLGYRPIPLELVPELRAAFPQRQFVERWWNVSASEPDERHIILPDRPDAPGTFDANGRLRSVAMTGLLGLGAGETAVSAAGDVLGREALAQLESGRQDVIFLPKQAAEQLDVRVGNFVRLAGRRLEVIGVYEPSDFDRRVTSLSGESITPLRYESGQLDASGRRLADVNAEQLALDADSGAAEINTSYLHLSSADVAIIHAELAKRLQSARLATVTSRVPDFKSAETLAKEIAQRLTMVQYAALEDGVQMISASNLAKITGAKVVIPLLIGGLIIFNTMMGSIAERKREISIYTSLGLAPVHVGALFVAEAMTYGVIGTVFGYIIGQGVGTLFQQLGWLGNMTLDYSGGSAMMTIGLILLVVLLSALVPARMASRLAAPSIERNWRVPLPVNDQIDAVLPFTINRTAAQGAIAFLAEYLDGHKEGSIGKFAAGDIRAGDGNDNDDRTRELIATIWLTPFDLGVRQQMTLRIAPGEFDDIYEVSIRLKRMSGDDASWYRMNRTFLTEIRKQFLAWRSLSPQRMREYIEKSKRVEASV